MKKLPGYLAGLLTGVMVTQGVVVLLGRNGLPGGEVLMVPLLLLTYWLGLDMGRGGRRDARH